MKRHAIISSISSMPEQKYFSELRPKHETAPQNEIAKQRYYRRLLAEQDQNTVPLFPNSNYRRNSTIYSRNPLALFEQNLRAYTLDPEFVNPQVCDYGIWGDFNIGHKLHLNIQADQVVEVSSYLREQGYNHKYLQARLDRGKIFTLYMGSKVMADGAAMHLSQYFDKILCRPLANDEIEYAPNIVGRFAEFGMTFNKDGGGVIRGIPMLLTDFDKFETGPKSVSPPWIRKAFERSFSRLADTYGTYFYGE